MKLRIKALLFLVLYRSEGIGGIITAVEKQGICVSLTASLCELPLHQQIGVLNPGDHIAVFEHRTNEQRQVRVRFDKGWTSIQTSDGTTLLSAEDLSNVGTAASGVYTVPQAAMLCAETDGSKARDRAQIASPQRQSSDARDTWAPHTRSPSQVAVSPTAAVADLQHTDTSYSLDAVMRDELHKRLLEDQFTALTQEMSKYEQERPWREPTGAMLAASAA